MHIAFTIAALGAGGAERVLSLMSAHWAGHRRITVIAFDAVHDLIYHPLDQRVEIIRLNLPSGGARLFSILAPLRRVIALRRALAKLQPDVVISFLTKINVVTLLASLGTSQRVVISERNNPQMQGANSNWNVLLARLSWRAGAIVMQTRGSLVCLDDKARQRALVINNPIEVPAHAAARSGRLVLAAVGRLTYQKGFDLLIAAFGAVAASHPGWTLRIWGEGELRADLERQVASLGLSHRIELPGVSRGPAEWVGDSDAFVFSSRYEGFGNALAEAAAAGLACVSFDCRFGPSDIIDHENNGLLVPQGDAGALSAALDRLMGDANLRQRLGEAARNDMARFALAPIMLQWEAALEQALNRGEARTGGQPEVR